MLVLIMAVPIGTGISLLATDTVESAITIDPTFQEFYQGSVILSVRQFALDSQNYPHMIILDRESSHYVTFSNHQFNSIRVGYECEISLVLDSQDHVHIAQTQRNDQDNSVLLYTKIISGSLNTETITNQSTYDHFLGSPTIVVDDLNYVHILFTESRWVESSDKWQNDLMYATNVGGSWNIYTMEEDVDLSYSKMLIDTQNIIHYVYVNGVSRGLNYAKFSEGSWVIHTIDNGIGYSIEALLDGEGKCQMCYIKNNELIYAVESDGFWIKQVVAHQSETFSMALDSIGHPHIVFIDTGGNERLRYTTRSDGTWQTITIEERVIGRAYLALDSQDHAHVVFSEMAGYDDLGYEYYDMMYATNMEGNWGYQSMTAMLWSSDIPVDMDTFFPIAIDDRDRIHVQYVPFMPAGGGSLYYATFKPTVVSPPGSPISFTATPGDGQVQLSWSPPLDDGGDAIDYFIVYQNDIDLAHVNGTLTTINGLTEGFNYDFAVAAHNGAGIGPRSEVLRVTLTASSDVPGTPTDLIASLEDGGVRLIWTVPSDDENITGYRIYRGTAPSTLQLIALVEGTSYLDDTVTSNRTYHYKVSAVNAVGEGELSDEVVILLPSSSTRTSFFDTVEGKVAIAGMTAAGLGAVAYALWHFRRSRT